MIVAVICYIWATSARKLKILRALKFRPASPALKRPFSLLAIAGILSTGKGMARVANSSTTRVFIKGNGSTTSQRERANSLIVTAQFMKASLGTACATALENPQNLTATYTRGIGRTICNTGLACRYGGQAEAIKEATRTERSMDRAHMCGRIRAGTREIGRTTI